MGKPNHTAGPWESNYDGHGGITIESADGHFIGYVAAMKNQKADAALIASAPDLLQALTRIYNAIDSCVELTPEVLQNARQAIKKATNEQA